MLLSFSLFSRWRSKAYQNSSQCARCKRDFTNGVRYVIENIQYCSTCAQKKAIENRVVYYIFIGLFILIIMAAAYMTYLDYKDGYPIGWDHIMMFLKVGFPFLFLALYSRMIVKRGAERIVNGADNDGNAE